MGIRLAGPRMTGVGLRPSVYSGTVPVRRYPRGCRLIGLFAVERFTGTNSLMGYGIPLRFG